MTPIPADRLRQLRQWHQDRADSWAATIRREPQSLPFTAQVLSEYEATEQAYRDTVRLIDAALSQPAQPAHQGAQGSFF